MEVLSVVAVVIVGLLVGTELSVAAFVHPTLNKLPDKVHQPAASALAGVLGKVMPVWYPLASLLTLAVTLVAWHESRTLPVWLAASTLLWVLVNVYSLTSLVPVNTRIASWEESTVPADWKTSRNTWDRGHRWRTVMLTLAFVLLVAGLVSR